MFLILVAFSATAGLVLPAPDMVLISVFCRNIAYNLKRMIAVLGVQPLIQAMRAA
jgi:hypothetical protein